METEVETKFVAADRVWVAVALLHQNFPERGDFTKDEIILKLKSEGLTDAHTLATFAKFIDQHCVSNLGSSGNHNYGLLFQPRPEKRRLFRPGDLTNPSRTRRSRLPKSLPAKGQIPSKYWHLLDWYEGWSRQGGDQFPSLSWEDDPLILLIGSGREIWADEHADEYVNNLRREDPE